MCGQLGAQLALPLFAANALPRWLGAGGEFSGGPIPFSFGTEEWPHPGEKPLSKDGTGLVARRLQINARITWGDHKPGPQAAAPSVGTSC